MIFEKSPLRASKVSVEDTVTELRLEDLSGKIKEITIILPWSIRRTFQHDKFYRLTIEEMPVAWEKA